MKRIGWMIVLAMAVGTAACAGVRSPVPVVASAADREAFAGEWSGSYRSFVTGRAGSIVLAIPADSAAATGDVLAARPIGVVPGAGRAEGMPSPAARDTTGPITIRVIRLRGRQMQGELAPYADPDCGCMPRTVFFGERSGDRIRGTYRASGAPEGVVEGTFELRRTRVTRKTPPGAAGAEG